MNANTQFGMSAAVVVIAALVIFARRIWAKAAAAIRWFSNRTHDLTMNFSGEDAVDPLELELQRRIARAGQKPQPGLYHSCRNGEWMGCAIVGTDRFGRPMVRFEKGEAPISVRSRAKLRAG